MKGQTLAILDYHKIGGPPAGGWETWFYVPEETFVAQLEQLREEGWEVIDLATFLAEPDGLPERAALLTFDDGYRSMRTVALPLLLRFGYPAALFVPTAFIGGTNDFEGGSEPEEPICGWEDLRELERGGVSIQSHGVSHRAFSELDPAEREEELLRSKETLEAGLGKRIEAFAYPYGDPGPLPTGEAPRHAGYRVAFGYKGGTVRLPARDAYYLPRLAMGPDTDLRTMLGDL